MCDISYLCDTIMRCLSTIFDPIFATTDLEKTNQDNEKMFFLPEDTGYNKDEDDIDDFVMVL